MKARPRCSVYLSSTLDDPLEAQRGLGIDIIAARHLRRVVLDEIRQRLSQIAEHVVRMMGEKRRDADLVFEGIKYSAWQNQKLRNWIKAAGINKNITIHNARHSYACLQISLGTDLYTVSKLLGHSSLKTTQIYAKVMDLEKITAANKIPELAFA